MVDTTTVESSQTAPDVQQEWDRLEAMENGGQAATSPDPDPAAPAPAQQDDQGQASRPPADPSPAPQAGGTEPQPDIWASAPPELKAAYEADKAKWERSTSSLGGRAQAEARRVAELTAEVEALRKKQPAAPEEPQAPKLTDEARAALREEYPDVAGPMLDVIGELEKKVERLAATDASQAEQRAAADALDLQRRYAEEEQRLSEAHSDWLDVVKQPAFAEWVQAQPRMVKEALGRNAEQITDAQEAADIIGRYKSSLPTSDGLQARRDAQLRGSEVPRSRTGVPTPSTTTDAKSEWDRLEALDRQRAAQSGGARSMR